MHPSTPTGASSQDLTRVNCGSMVSLAPRTLHLAPCTLHLAPRTSHPAPRTRAWVVPSLSTGYKVLLLNWGWTCVRWSRGTPLALCTLHLAPCLPRGSQPSCHRTCSLVLGSRAHLHLFCLPHGLQPPCHRTCSLVLWLEGAPAPLLLASRLATPLAIGLALSSFGSGRLPHGSHPSRHRTCSLVPWREGAPAPLLLAPRLATLSSPDLRTHLFPPFPTVTRRQGDDFGRVRGWGNRDRETIP